MSELLAWTEDGQEHTVGSRHFRYVGRGDTDAYCDDIVLWLPDHKIDPYLHGHCFALSAPEAGSWGITLEPTNWLPVEVIDQATGEGETFIPADTRTVDARFRFPSAEIWVRTLNHEHRLTVNAGGGLTTATRDPLGHDTPRASDHFPPSDSVSRVVIAMCINALRGERHPPTHDQVAAILRGGLYPRDATLSRDGVSQRWARAVPRIQGYMAMSRTEYPGGEAFRLFSPRWLVDRGYVTLSSLAAVAPQV